MKKDIRLEDLPIYEIIIDEDDSQGIRMVSLVSDPAIEMKGMYFSNNLEKDFAFKTIGDKQIIVGPAMIPNKKILRKDDNDNLYYVYFTPETIKLMVDKFLKDNNNKSLNVDHSNEMVNGFIQASWIVEDPIYDKSRYYGFNLPKGSWFIEVKIDDTNFWLKDVKEEGKFGFSIEGLMNQKLVEMNTSIEEVLDTLTENEFIQIFFEKISFDFDGTLSQKNIQKLAESKIKNGDDVYIITKRPRSENVLELASKLGIKEKNVIFTDHEPKWSFIKDLGIDVHYDNVNSEANEIENKTKARVVLVPSNVKYEIENFENTYNDYPKAAIENAKIALRWVDENGWGSCGTSVGKIRANQLAKGESISRETIARMASFERHRQNSQKKLGDGCGRLMWLAWGGDEGVEWAKRKLKQIDNEEFVVNPGKKENKDEFIQRCMEVEVGSGKDQDQAYAICIAKWKNK